MSYGVTRREQGRADHSESHLSWIKSHLTVDRAKEILEIQVWFQLSYSISSKFKKSQLGTALTEYASILAVLGLVIAPASLSVGQGAGYAFSMVSIGIAGSFTDSGAGNYFALNEDGGDNGNSGGNNEPSYGEELSGGGTTTTGVQESLGDGNQENTEGGSDPSAGSDGGDSQDGAPNNSTSR